MEWGEGTLRRFGQKGEARGKVERGERQDNGRETGGVIEHDREVERGRQREGRESNG